MNIICYILATILCVFWNASSRAQDVEDLIKSTFRNSILKIEVSNNAPVFDTDGVNICKSEGSGFLISSQYVVTAEHVFKLSDKCTNPVIVLESRLPNTQRVAQVVGSYNDVALLKINEPLPSRICALRVLASNVYASKGLRFGIPHDLKDPEAVPVDIGEQDNEFSPMIVLTPTFTEHGESGGPVIYQFNVVGVTRAKSDVHAGYSFMESADNIRYLMDKFGVITDGKPCNPAEMFMYNAGTGDPDIGVKSNDELSPNLRAKALDEASKAVFDVLGTYVVGRAVTLNRVDDAIYITKNRAGSSPVTGNQTNGGPNPVINNPGQIFGGLHSVFHNPGYMLGEAPSSFSRQPVIAMSPNNPAYRYTSHPAPDVSLSRASAEIATKLECRLWDQFVKETMGNPGVEIAGSSNSLITNSAVGNSVQSTQASAGLSLELNALNELQKNVSILEAAIIQARITASNGSMSIPSEIRKQLTGYASEDSMNRVRYNFANNGFDHLASLLEQGGAADAVTLVDVIVFRGPSEASDLSTWAHQLTHVDQYRDWGVHGFAVQYVRNWHSVEDPAYAKGNGFIAWRQHNLVGLAPQQTAVGAFCYTLVGRFGPGPIQPLGASCAVTTPQGKAFGQVGN